MPVRHHEPLTLPDLDRQLVSLTILYASETKELASPGRELERSHLDPALRAKIHRHAGGLVDALCELERCLPE